MCVLRLGNEQFYGVGDDVESLEFLENFLELLRIRPVVDFLLEGFNINLCYAINEFLKYLVLG